MNHTDVNSQSPKLQPQTRVNTHTWWTEQLVHMVHFMHGHTKQSHPLDWCVRVVQQSLTQNVLMQSIWCRSDTRTHRSHLLNPSDVLQNLLQLLLNASSPVHHPEISEIRTFFSFFTGFHKWKIIHFVCGTFQRVCLKVCIPPSPIHNLYVCVCVQLWQSRPGVRLRNITWDQQ